MPEPGPGQIRLKVLACGVCRTDLHLLEGDLAPRRAEVVPGHEVVGVLDAAGPAATRFQAGELIGVPWLARTCGVCKFCRRGQENLCLSPLFTGWDLDGGYAEYVVAYEDYLYRLPTGFSAESAAPLLCAGIIGYRALRRAQLPRGGALGIYGFGASAHLCAQVALHEGARVHVMTRSRVAQRLAMDLGASSAQGDEELAPEHLDAAVLFAPLGALVPVALRSLDRAGTLAVAGIYLSDIPSLHYQEELFNERNLVSVTANTRRDGEEFLDIAQRYSLKVITTSYPMSAAATALADLGAGALRGAAVLLA